MKAVVLWTGGKDSYLAFCRAKSKYDIVYLVTFVPRDPSFKAHPLPVIEAQAALLNIPFLKLLVEAPYKEGYIKAIRKLKTDYQIEMLITGDIAEVEGHPNWIKECADEVGVKVHMPLWGEDRSRLMNEIIKNESKVIFSLVKEPYFDAKWVGREITLPVIQELSKKGVDLCGENGEFHTLVLNGKHFNSGLSLQFNTFSEKGMHYLKLSKESAIIKFN